jgi:hypothetical protein
MPQELHLQRVSDVSSHGSVTSDHGLSGTGSEKINKHARTFFLASPSLETTKMSSLSKKLNTDHHKISLQSSDTSFTTTKSGATFATSHSTSTGMSRSSRKTQALIERFERHGAVTENLARTTRHERHQLESTSIHYRDAAIEDDTSWTRKIGSDLFYQ